MRCCFFQFFAFALLLCLGCQVPGRVRPALPQLTTTAKPTSVGATTLAATVPTQAKSAPTDRLPPVVSAAVPGVKLVDFQAPAGENASSTPSGNESPLPAPARGAGLPPPVATTFAGGTVSLDFATALGSTEEQNPRIAFAQAQVSQAYAQHEAARVLWLPNIRVGGNYNKHDGRLQDVEGRNFEISRSAAFGGLGAGAVGAGSPSVPGVYLNMHTTDVIFQRRITNYRWQASSQMSAAMLNDQLLETALAYLSLLEAAQRQAIAHDTLRNGEDLAQLTANFVKAGAGNQADADRAQAVLAIFRTETLRAEEGFTVASARVAQLMSADPTVQIIPQETNIVPIELVPLAEGEYSHHVATALSNRPELSASRSLVCEAVNRLERERYAPWLPSVLLGASHGMFGAGTGGSITNGADRVDFDAVAWWEVRNFGAGERAARNNAQAQIQQARMREVETMDLIAREVVEGITQVQSRRRQMEVAQAGIQSAQQSYQRNRDRIKNAQGLPIEVLQAIQALDQAQREYLRTLVDFNTAQFRLHRALGCPIQDVGQRVAASR